MRVHGKKEDPNTCSNKFRFERNDKAYVLNFKAVLPNIGGIWSKGVFVAFLICPLVKFKVLFKLISFEKL